MAGPDRELPQRSDDQEQRLHQQQRRRRWAAASTSARGHRTNLPAGGQHDHQRQHGDAGRRGLAFDLAESGNASFNFSTIVNNTTRPRARAAGSTRRPSGRRTTSSSSSGLDPRRQHGGRVALQLRRPGRVPGRHLDREHQHMRAHRSRMVNTDPQIAPSGHLPRRRADDPHARASAPAPRELLRRLAGSCAALHVDQRYVTRPAGRGCDVGAFEATVGPNPTRPAAAPRIRRRARRPRPRRARRRKRRRRRASRAPRGQEEEEKGLQKKKKKKK